MHKQSGGTLLGIIIGLIVGLGIAVVVAVTITKTSLPFSSRPAKAERSAEQNANQITDPNKPLYGNREPAKEAAKQFIKPDVPASIEEEKLNSTDPDSAKPAVKTDNKPVAEKPKTPEAAAKPDAAKAPAKTDGSEEKWTYHLQAGAFRERADAESARARLALLGFEANISEKQSDNGVLYRVRIGPFTQLETMNRIRGKLTDNGVDAAVVRTAR